MSKVSSTASEQVRPPFPPLGLSVLTWVRGNLFNSWYNTLLTLICLWGLAWLGTGLFQWITTQAQWAVVRANLRLFLVGRFPARLNWRLWVVLALLVITLSLTWGGDATVQSLGLSDGGYSSLQRHGPCPGC